MYNFNTNASVLKSGACVVFFNVSNLQWYQTKCYPNSKTIFFKGTENFHFSLNFLLLLWHRSKVSLSVIQLQSLTEQWTCLRKLTWKFLTQTMALWILTILHTLTILCIHTILKHLSLVFHDKKEEKTPPLHHALSLTFFCRADDKFENCPDLLLLSVTTGLHSAWNIRLGFLKQPSLYVHILDHRLPITKKRR